MPTTLDRPFPPLPGASFTTLCGLDVELTVDDFRRALRPSCSACTAAWREHQAQSTRRAAAEKDRARR
ncbi:MAG: zinc finger protein [Bryobacteraceae bacterium]